MNRGVFLAIVWIVVATGTAAGQPATPPSPAAAPPVLSTVPSPAAGMMPQPSQMSGMPLQVGDLPPGVVVIRVIRQTFQNNVANQAVLLRASATGRVLSAVTGPDGRARFDGIAVGDQVQVRTAVGAETLESQPFAIPAQAGVRVVLAAGIDAGTPTPVPWPAPTASDTTAVAAAAPSAVAVPPAAGASSGPPGSSWRRAGVITGLVLIGGSALAWLGLPGGQRRSDRPAPASHPEPAAIAAAVLTSPPQSPARGPDVQRLRARRAQLFEDLVGLEKDHAAGRASDHVRRERHEALVSLLAELDGQIEDSRST